MSLYTVSDIKNIMFITIYYKDKSLEDICLIYDSIKSDPTKLEVLNNLINECLNKQNRSIKIKQLTSKYHLTEDFRRKMLDSGVLKHKNTNIFICDIAKFIEEIITAHPCTQED